MIDRLLRFLFTRGWTSLELALVLVCLTVIFYLLLAELIDRIADWKARRFHARQVARATDLYVSRLKSKTRTPDTDPISELDATELGIGASVFGDLSPGFREGAGVRRTGARRLFRAAPWLAGDDQADYGQSTSLVTDAPAKDRVNG